MGGRLIGAWKLGDPPIRRCRHCSALVQHVLQTVRGEMCPLCLKPMRRSPWPERQAAALRRAGLPLADGTRRHSARWMARTVRLACRDGGMCWLCGRWLGDDITHDHVVPRSKGGSLALSNLRLAHRACNERRGDADADVFRQAVAR